MVLAGYMGCRAEWAIFFFILSVGFNTFTVPGCKTSMLDFAPCFAGTDRVFKRKHFTECLKCGFVIGVIMGISNTLANFTGFLAPQTTGYLLKADNSLGQWQLAFWISAMVYVPGFIAFQIFGTDKLQPWAKNS